MKAEKLIEKYPTLSPEDAVYSEKRSNQELWFMCVNSSCNTRPFVITTEQFEDAGYIIECEICSNECTLANKPEWIAE